MCRVGICTKSRGFAAPPKKGITGHQFESSRRQTHWPVLAAGILRRWRRLSLSNRLVQNSSSISINAPAHRQFNFPSEAKGAVRAPWITNCLPLLKVFKVLGIPSERTLGAEISYTKCQHTGPSFEVKISRSPALPCPTASRDNRHHLRRIPAAKLEDGPMANEFVKSPARHMLQRADPKKAVLMGGYFLQEAVSSP
jgi:hypothetical protein